jgi:DNA polymerase-3 subunit delta
VARACDNENAMSVHLLVGDDEAILRSAVSTLVHSLVGEADRALVVDEYDGDDYTLGAVADAAQTPPFLSDARVVVARGASRFNAEELVPLLAYLDDPLESTHLVVEWGGQRRPKALTDALARAGAAVIPTTPPNRPRERQAWVSDEAAAAGVRLTAAAAERLTAHLGEQVSGLEGILRTLAGTFGAGARVGPEELEPFLGEAGGVPPWELTDAIDAGRTGEALQLLGRMMGTGERHPLQVMAILQGHYGRLAALDGLDLRSDSDAAAVLGIKPGFPARKALEQSRRLGGQSIRRAVELLAAADLDLRGRSMLDERLVMELLVARLSRLRGERPAARVRR